jgi:hypothetical protein
VIFAAYTGSWRIFWSDVGFRERGSERGAEGRHLNPTEEGKARKRCKIQGDLTRLAVKSIIAEGGYLGRQALLVDNHKHGRD